MKFCVITVLSLLLLSCNTTETPTVPTETQQITEDLTSWENYWKVFQAATTEMDKEKIATLTHWSENMTEDIFNDSFESYFGKEMQDLIATTKAKEIQLSDEPITDFEEERELMWYEEGEEDGITYESAMILYFGKVDGNYKMTLWLAAG